MRDVPAAAQKQQAGLCCPRRRASPHAHCLDDFGRVAPGILLETTQRLLAGEQVNALFEKHSEACGCQERVADCPTPARDRSLQSPDCKRPDSPRNGAVLRCWQTNKSVRDGPRPTAGPPWPSVSARPGSPDSNRPSPGAASRMAKRAVAQPQPSHSVPRNWQTVGSRRLARQQPRLGRQPAARASSAVQPCSAVQRHSAAQRRAVDRPAAAVESLAVWPTTRPWPP